MKNNFIEKSLNVENLDLRTCKKCSKIFVNKYNLKRHDGICMLKDMYKCNYCEDIFSKKKLLIQHIEICKCKKYKERIDELEIIIKELMCKIVILDSESDSDSENVSFVDILETDIDVNLFSVHNILDYGKSIGLFICVQNSNILKKIKLKNKKEKIIKYRINNKDNKDDGFLLIQYILYLLKNQIVKIINDKFSFIKENDILYNDHTKRILNIKNIEIDEILNEKKKNNLYKEIYNTIFEFKALKC